MENQFISLGAGVQSTVMLLLADRGLLLPKPTAAIFADTGWEPSAVYRHLDWLERQVSIEVIRVQQGDLFSDTWDGVDYQGSVFTHIPRFLAAEEGGRRGMTRRSCTTNYKIRPIHNCIKDRIGRKPRGKETATVWIGISTDEAMRMKDSRDVWLTNRYPLIELNWSRQDCRQWFAELYPEQPLAKSSCVGCPYHSDRQWLELSRSEPEIMARTVELDKRLRDPERPTVQLKGVSYLHSSTEPLGEVLERLEKADQQQLKLDGFEGIGNECSGYCWT